MPAYTFTQRYRSSYGRGDEGDQVEMTEAQAADINRDAPGTLVSHTAKADDAETRALDAPPKNRQVTGASKRRKTGGDA